MTNYSVTVEFTLENFEGDEALAFRHVSRLLERTEPLPEGTDWWLHEGAVTELED